MTRSDSTDRFGLERGKVYPASKARQLLNPARRLLQPPRRVVRQMCLAPTMRVLEIGSGPGYFSVDLARAVSKGSLVVCDLQAAILRFARRRTADARNVSAVQGDALSIPFAAESFDAVLLVAVLGEVPDQQACVHEIRRICRRDATVTVAETRRDSDFIALTRLSPLFETAGYSLIDRHGFAFEYVARFGAN